MQICWSQGIAKKQQFDRAPILHMNKIHLLILQHLSNRQRCARTLYGIRGAEELHYLCPLSTLIVHMRAQSKHSSQSDKAAPKSFRPLAHTSFSLSSRV